MQKITENLEVNSIHKETCFIRLQEDQLLGNIFSEMQSRCALILRANPRHIDLCLQHLSVVELLGQSVTKTSKKEGTFYNLFDHPLE